MIALRRLAAVLVTGLVFLAAPTTRAASGLPESTTFRGGAVFDRLVARAQQENWAALPLGERTAKVGLALVGTPYRGFTLEIDDRVEAPSVNFTGLDCWTFYEVSLGFARMLHAKNPPYAPADLLRMIELERYRGGQCTGAYLSRIHFLEELFYDNERRGLLTNITRQLPGAEKMGHRDIREMTVMWKHYRYLRNNPGLRPGMAVIESRVSDLPVYHVPKRYVPEAEREIQTGDIIAVTSRDTGGYTSHVGLAYRERAGNIAVPACVVEARARAGGRSAVGVSGRQAGRHRDRSGAAAGGWERGLGGAVIRRAAPPIPSAKRLTQVDRALRARWQIAAATAASNGRRRRRICGA